MQSEEVTGELGETSKEILLLLLLDFLILNLEHDNLWVRLHPSLLLRGFEGEDILNGNIVELILVIK